MDLLWPGLVWEQRRSRDAAPDPRNPWESRCPHSLPCPIPMDPLCFSTFLVAVLGIPLLSFLKDPKEQEKDKGGEGGQRHSCRAPNNSPAPQGGGGSTCLFLQTSLLCRSNNGYLWDIYGYLWAAHWCSRLPAGMTPFPWDSVCPKAGECSGMRG